VPSTISPKSTFGGLQIRSERYLPLQAGGHLKISFAGLAILEQK